MKDILLVLIGAIISCGTTFFLDWIKCGREEKIYYKRKREEVLLSSINYIHDLYAKLDIYRQRKDFPNSEREKHNLMLAQVKMYTAKKIQTKFYSIMSHVIGNINGVNAKADETLVDDYIKIIKQDLKIEDK